MYSILLLCFCSSHTLEKFRIKWSESRSVASSSLWPHGLYSPWNSPGHNTGMGSLSLLQESQPRILTQLSCIAGRFFTSWATYFLLKWYINANICIQLPLTTFLFQLRNAKWFHLLKKKARTRYLGSLIFFYFWRITEVFSPNNIL